jgi:hypothetical protein
MTAYFESLAHFNIVIEDGIATQNGDDAIELFLNGEVIETFGDIDCQPSSDGVTVVCPSFQFYEDAWAYKEDGVWIFGAAQCTDDSTTTLSSDCPYPFIDAALSNNIFDSQQFSVYPNPAENGYIYLDTILEGNKNVKIFDMNGRKVFEENTAAQSLDINRINQGFYIIQVTANNKTLATKLVIK